MDHPIYPKRILKRVKIITQCKECMSSMTSSIIFKKLTNCHKIGINSTFKGSPTTSQMVRQQGRRNLIELMEDK